MKQLFILGLFHLSFQHVFFGSLGSVCCGSETSVVVTALSSSEGTGLALNVRF